MLIGMILKVQLFMSLFVFFYFKTTPLSVTPILALLFK